ncbi:MAG: hypothetical protein WCJ51_02220, partial [Candidatus Moraniibacteriota bacterium]
ACTACVEKRGSETIKNIEKIYQSGNQYKFIIFDEKKKVAKFSKEYAFYYGGWPARYEFFYDVIPEEKIWIWIRVNGHEKLVQFHIHGQEDLPIPY